MASFPDVRVGVPDTQFSNTDSLPGNIDPLHGLSSREVLGDAIRSYKPTHISCISVIEHARPAAQKGIFEALESEFHGTTFAMTHVSFTNNHDPDDGHRFAVTTTASLSAMVSPLTRYYLDDVASAPIHAVNAFHEFSAIWRSLAARFVKA